MVMHYKEIYALDNNAITRHPCEKDTNQSVSTACKTHGHDENSCSMNAPNTGYNEAGVEDSNQRNFSG